MKALGSALVEKFFAAVGSRDLDLIERLAVGAQTLDELRARVREHHAAEQRRLDARFARARIRHMRLTAS